MPAKRTNRNNGDGHGDSYEVDYDYDSDDDHEDGCDDGLEEEGGYEDGEEGGFEDVEDGREESTGYAGSDDELERIHYEIFELGYEDVLRDPKTGKLPEGFEKGKGRGEPVPIKIAKECARKEITGTAFLDDVLHCIEKFYKEKSKSDGTSHADNNFVRAVLARCAEAAEAKEFDEPYDVLLPSHAEILTVRYTARNGAFNASIGGLLASLHATRLMEAPLLDGHVHPVNSGGPGPIVDTTAHIAIGKVSEDLKKTEADYKSFRKSVQGENNSFREMLAKLSREVAELKSKESDDAAEKFYEKALNAIAKEARDLKTDLENVREDLDKELARETIASEQMSTAIAETEGRINENIGTRLDELNNRAASTDTRFIKIDGRLGKMDVSIGMIGTRFGKMDARVSMTDAILSAMGARVEELAAQQSVRKVVQNKDATAGLKAGEFSTAQAAAPGVKQYARTSSRLAQGAHRLGPEATKAVIVKKETSDGDLSSVPLSSVVAPAPAPATAPVTRKLKITLKRRHSSSSLSDSDPGSPPPGNGDAIADRSSERAKDVKDTPPAKKKRTALKTLMSRHSKETE